MEFIDLKAQQKIIRNNLDSRLTKVLDEGRYILGEEVQELEKKLSHFCGSKHSITCANGTDALVLALMALGIGEGDAVITVPFTYIATIESICLVGATPILVDVYDSTFNMNPELLEDAIKNNSNAKAIMAVDLFGLPARYRLINEIAKKYDLKVIGDTAQSFGSSKDGKRAGTFCDITTTSFFPAKPLGCYGDGGAIFTQSDKLCEDLKSLRVHGKGIDKYDNIKIGMNSRLDTMQAAILLEKLNIFDEEIEKRNEIANLYRDFFAKTDLVCQHIPEGYKSVYAQFSILFTNNEIRNHVQYKLSEKKIPSVVYYGISGHMQTGYKHLNYKAGDFPVSENLSQRILSLPMHPYLEKIQVEEIAESIIKII
ncbi:DegT/DnrJ/EryC1/StrS family aminotransferase [Candidatus Marinimicrobia bacterium]|nr:DegT/DnrJ/EryC1/StrS family aminotransferase [Candidatus Neomarinimicrobiota bacterium]